MTFYNIIFQHNFSIILLKYCMSTKGNNSDNIIDVQHDNMNTSKLNIDVFLCSGYNLSFWTLSTMKPFPSVTHTTTTTGS